MNLYLKLYHDTFKHLKILLATTTCFLLVAHVQAQTIPFLSFEGKKIFVNVLYNGKKEILTVSSFKKKLYIRNVNNFNSAEVVNRHFLKVAYTVHAGTGLNVRQTLLLGISNKTLYQLLHIISFFKEEFIDFSKDTVTPNSPDIISKDETILDFPKSAFPNYKVNIWIRQQMKKKDNPSDNYDRKTNLTLNFDTFNNVFYSSHINLSQGFSFFDPKTQKTNKMSVTGIFPSISIGSYSFYYIKGEWYEKYEEEHTNDLSKLSYY